MLHASSGEQELLSFKITHKPDTDLGLAKPDIITREDYGFLPHPDKTSQAFE